MDCSCPLLSYAQAAVNPSEEFLPLIDDIFREKVLRARAMSPEKRFLESFELFEMGVSMMRDGVRAQHREFTEEQVDQKVSRRFAVVRQMEEHGIYRPVS